MFKTTKTTLTHQVGPSNFSWLKQFPRTHVSLPFPHFSSKSWFFPDPSLFPWLLQVFWASNHPVKCSLMSCTHLPEARVWQSVSWSLFWSTLLQVARCHPWHPQMTHACLSGNHDVTVLIAKKWLLLKKVTKSKKNPTSPENRLLICFEW